MTLVEAEQCGWGRAGRNGGFVSSSLTHGIANGHARWPDEMGKARADRNGQPAGFTGRHREPGHRLRLRANGKTGGRDRPIQMKGLAHTVDLARTYRFARSNCSPPMLYATTSDPPDFSAARRSRGVRARQPRPPGLGLSPSLPRPRRDDLRRHRNQHAGPHQVRAGPCDSSVQLGNRRNVASATNAAPSLLRRLRLYTVPVRDYAKLIEPPSPEHRASLGWRAGRR